MTEPDKITSHEQFYKRMAKNIAEHGHTVIGVGAGKNSFFYSIGLWARKLPELLICLPMPFEDGQAAINRAALLLKQREYAFDENQELDIGFSVKVRAHTPKNLAYVRREFTIQAGQFWKTEDYPVQQILFPDMDGKWPGERGHKMPIQRLLK